MGAVENTRIPHSHIADLHPHIYHGQVNPRGKIH
jgi:hypothetical protein